MDGLWKGGQSKNCTHCLHHSSVHSSLSCELPVAKGGWVLESGVWRTDPGRGQLLAVKRQPEGTGVKSSTTGKVCGKNPGHHRSKASLLSGVQGQSCHYNPFPHPPASLASEGTGRGSYLSGWGLLCPHGLWEPKYHPSQSLLGNQPWVPLPGTRVH